MANYARGEIVWAKAEKTVSGGYKPRPVLILASWPCNGTFDYLVCICSTTDLMDPYKFSLCNEDFESGGFPDGEDRGFVRPTYLTAIVDYDITGRIGVLKTERVTAALQSIQGVLQ